MSEICAKKVKFALSVYCVCPKCEIFNRSFCQKFRSCPANMTFSAPLYKNTNYVPVAVNAPPEKDSESDVSP